MPAKPLLQLRVIRRRAQGQEAIGSPLDSALARMVDLAPALRAVVGAWRSIILDYEFAGQQWLTPTGRTRSWPRLSGIGGRVSEPLGSRARTAWSGGAGGFTRISQNRAEFGVTGSALPYLQYHRGGTGKLLESDIVGKGNLVTSEAQIRPWKLTRGTRNWRHPQKWAIWWKLFFLYGIMVSGRKLAEGLFTPFRPHASANPVIRTRAAAMLAAYIVGKPMPKFTGVKG